LILILISPLSLLLSFSIQKIRLHPRYPREMLLSKVFLRLCCIRNEWASSWFDCVGRTFLSAAFAFAFDLDSDFASFAFAFFFYSKNPRSSALSA